jgi:hypothetical protein
MPLVPTPHLVLTHFQPTTITPMSFMKSTQAQLAFSKPGKGDTMGGGEYKNIEDTSNSGSVMDT